MNIKRLLSLWLVAQGGIIPMVSCQESEPASSAQDYQSNLYVDVHQYKELYERLLLLINDQALLANSPSLQKVALLLQVGSQQIPVALLQSLIAELQSGIEGSRSFNLEILSRQLAAIGLGLNYTTSTAPSTTLFAPQRAVQPGATQLVKIACSDPAATTDPSPVQSGFEIDLGTGYNDDVTPQIIRCGSKSTTFVIKGHLTFDPPPTNGQLLIGNGTTGEFDLNTLTPGDGITITNSPGSILIASASSAGSSYILSNSATSITTQANKNFPGVIAINNTDGDGSSSTAISLNNQNASALTIGAGNTTDLILSQSGQQTQIVGSATVAQGLGVTGQLTQSGGTFDVDTGSDQVTITSTAGGVDAISITGNSLITGQLTQVGGDAFIGLVTDANNRQTRIGTNDDGGSSTGTSTVIVGDNVVSSSTTQILGGLTTTVDTKSGGTVVLGNTTSTVSLGTSSTERLNINASGLITATGELYQSGGDATIGQVTDSTSRQTLIGTNNNVVGSTGTSTVIVGDNQVSTSTTQILGGLTTTVDTKSTGTVILGDATSGLSLRTNSTERLSVNSSGAISINAFNTAGVVHNYATGELYSALVSTADTTATSTNTPGRLVARDSSGNFAAGTITATLNGNASTATSSTSFTGSLAGDVTGTQAATAVAFVGGQSASNVAAATALANAATNTNTVGAIVRRDGTGSFSAGTVTAATSVLTPTVDTPSSGTLSVGPSTATAVSITPPTSLLSTLTVPAGTAGAPSIRVGSSTTSGIYAPESGTVSISSSSTERLRVNASGVTIPTFTTAGVVHNAASGLLSSSLIVNADITVGAITNDRLATISSADTPGAIVVRDGSGNFATNMITIDGTPSVGTDVATVDYVNTAVSTGFTVLAPALYASTSSSEVTASPPANSATIDGFAVATGNRVLLTAQTNAIDNGLWDVNTAGNWTRPTDFAADDTANSSYVFITGGTNYSDSSWVCTTPTAIIGTDPLTFTLFSVVATTGNNVGVGAGTGQVFKNKTGNFLNFRSIAAGTHLTVQNNPGTDNTVDIATDATNANTLNTIVARDGSGNFSAGTITASLTGAASANVLKAGDTMTGPLTMAWNGAFPYQVRFGDSSVSTNYVGLTAPTAVTASYNVSLPAAAPVAGQFLQAASASSLQWATPGGLPTATRTIYVSLSGSDSNDGSLTSPYRTISYAVQQANTLATLANPVVIQVGAGAFVEDNSAGPLQITASGVSIIGESYTGTIIRPSTPANQLLRITDESLGSSQQVILQNLLFDASGLGSTSAAVAVVDSQTSTPYFSTAVRLDSVVIRGFQTGVLATSNTTVANLTLENLTFRGNTTAVDVQGVQTNLKNSLIFGPLLGTVTTPVNTGLKVQASSLAVIANVIGSLFSTLDDGIEVTGAVTRIVGCNIDRAVNGVVATGGASVSLTGVNVSANPPGAVSVAATGAGTAMTIDGCHFNCADTDGAAAGTAMRVVDQATITAVGVGISNAAVGIDCGTSSDTATTVMRADGVALVDCTQSVVQHGLSTMRFLGGVFDSTKVTINDATNVSFAAYDRDGNDALTLGTTHNVDQVLYQVYNGAVSPFPNMTYKPVLYGSQATVYTDTTATSTAVLALGNDAREYVITADRTKKAGISLRSDTTTIGADDGVLSWSMTKLGTGADSAKLAFEFSNNDISPTIDAYSVMRLNGFANQVEFPLVTTGNVPTYGTARLVWAGEPATNLYRSASGTLNTDANFTVAQTCTANSLVSTNGATLGSADASHTIRIGASATSAGSTQMIKIGDSTAPAVVTIGNTAQANSSVSILGGSTGGVNLNTTGNGSTTIGGTGTGSVQLQSGAASIGAIKLTASASTSPAAIQLVSAAAGGGITLQPGTGGVVTIPTLTPGGAVSANTSGALSAGTLSVANGGTGVTSLTQYGVLLGGGTTPITTVSGLGSAGQVLTSNGTGSAPTWQAITATVSNVSSPTTITMTTRNASAVPATTVFDSNGTDGNVFLTATSGSFNLLSKSGSGMILSPGNSALTVNGTVKGYFENNTTPTTLKIAAGRVTVAADGTVTIDYKTNNVTVTRTAVGTFTVGITNMSQIFGCSATIMTTNSSVANNHAIYATPIQGATSSISIETHSGSNTSDGIDFTFIAYGNE